MRAHIALVSIIVALACRDACASDSWATEVQQAVQTRTATAPSTRENWHAFSPDGIGMPLVMFGVYSAHQSIHMLAYVLTYRPLLEALAQKAREGVTVSVVVDYNENIANDRDAYIQRGLAYLARSGATVCATDQYKIMHDKDMVLDGRSIQTGSINYTKAGTFSNSEDAVIEWNDTAGAADFERHFQSRLATCRPI
ncbi:phosphatidylserine synthase (plasmid) [Paraburkholderia phytofirmans OLGA172]|uniref:phospholipase D n=1 Tax=Paraburkholderia phytofirmans OLGA172 TaxID=1417228 RepID=A0A161I8N6_9BURK|nr:phospholipase D-like domain-containing protein [Paraburkholderia phytofirmans]ANB77994.1 phosphatidylserine synthase [Paraburkholderia phytofirmans OLGA172]